jgi:hypothetical protein
MTKRRELPRFATEPWYNDPRDHRCPHDAWLESVEISEAATGQRNEVRRTVITVRLLGAYHDGRIVFRYRDVSNFTLSGVHTLRGLGDWLSDKFVHSDTGSLVHEILWAGLPRKGKSRWVIEARDISYEWIPDSAA